MIHCPSFCADDVDSSDQAFSHLWEQQRGKIKALEDKYRWKLNENGVSQAERKCVRSVRNDRVVWRSDNENTTCIKNTRLSFDCARWRYTSDISSYLYHLANRVSLRTGWNGHAHALVHARIIVHTGNVSLAMDTCKNVV